MGVPQGSILRPLLFSIFVIDLPAALFRSKVMLYADETTVYFADPSGQRAQWKRCSQRILDGYLVG